MKNKMLHASLVKQIIGYLQNKKFSDLFSRQREK